MRLQERWNKAAPALAVFGSCLVTLVMIAFVVILIGAWIEQQGEEKPVDDQPCPAPAMPGGC
jgi:hypothetical protein